jgi:queuine/archaeosine tRNA-ribosyltransferase
MLTDSGGYQIFSMGFGSVSNEIKCKRNLTNVPQVLPLFYVCM